MRLMVPARSELSRSSTPIGSRVASPALKIAARKAIWASGTIVARPRRKGRRRSQPISRQKTNQKPGRMRLRASISTSSVGPCNDGTHAGTQAIDRLYRPRPYFEGAEIEIAGSARGPPCGVLPLHIDHGDPDRNNLRLQSRHGQVEFVADLQPAEQILAQVECEPQVLQVDHREQRRPRAEILAERSDTCGHLAGDRGTDGEFGYVDITLIQCSFSLLHLSRGKSALFLARARCRKLQCSLRGLTFARRRIEIAGYLIDACLRCVAGARQLRLPIAGFLVKRLARLCRTELSLARRDRLRPGARDSIQLR